MLVRMWREKNPPALLMEIKTGTATVENSMEFSQKSKIEGRLGGTAVKRLPSAQGVIPALRDRAPHRAPPL